MECRETRQRIQDLIDGRLPPGEAEEVRRHLRACAPCAAEEADLTRVGDLLRPWSAPLLRRWFFVPGAAALAVLILLFYPSDGTRAPFHPKSFDVTVESLESDTATVALVDKGEELPRVIWVIEHGKT